MSITIHNHTDVRNLSNNVLQKEKVRLEEKIRKWDSDETEKKVYYVSNAVLTGISTYYPPLSWATPVVQYLYYYLEGISYLESQEKKETEKALNIIELELIFREKQAGCVLL